MTNQELLIKVKMGLGITGNYQDDTLLLYVDEVKDYLRSAGIPNNVVESNRVIGVIIRGVSDLWNYGSGDTSLSPYFKERVNQLRVGIENV